MSQQITSKNGKSLLDAIQGYFNDRRLAITLISILSLLSLGAGFTLIEMFAPEFMKSLWIVVPMVLAAAILMVAIVISITLFCLGKIKQKNPVVDFGLLKKGARWVIGHPLAILGFFLVLAIVGWISEVVAYLVDKDTFAPIDFLKMVGFGHAVSVLTTMAGFWIFLKVLRSGKKKDADREGISDNTYLFFVVAGTLATLSLGFITTYMGFSGLGKMNLVENPISLGCGLIIVNLIPAFFQYLFSRAKFIYKMWLALPLLLLMLGTFYFSTIPGVVDSTGKFLEKHHEEMEGTRWEKYRQSLNERLPAVFNSRFNAGAGRLDASLDTLRATRLTFAQLETGEEQSGTLSGTAEEGPLTRCLKASIAILDVLIAKVEEDKALLHRKHEDAIDLIAGLTGSDSENYEANRMSLHGILSLMEVLIDQEIKLELPKQTMGTTLAIDSGLKANQEKMFETIFADIDKLNLALSEIKRQNGIVRKGLAYERFEPEVLSSVELVLRYWRLIIVQLVIHMVLDYLWLSIMFGLAVADRMRVVQRGVTLEQVSAKLDALEARLNSDPPKSS
jgi:hypothetical protein